MHLAFATHEKEDLNDSSLVLLFQFQFNQTNLILSAQYR